MAVASLAMSETLRLRTDDLTWRTVEQEVVVLDQRDSTYIGINATGAALWPLLVEGASRADLIGALVTRFGISHDQAAPDVDAFIEALVARNFLTSA